MKFILITMTFLVWSSSIFASDTTILFREIEYSDLFETAKNEAKAVMLYFHFDGCGACVKMKKTAFKDKSVYDYYNSNFINFEINTLKDKGIEINKLYNIRLHPTFIFLDNSGNELHRIVGVYSPNDFLSQAQNILKTNKTLTNYKKLYNDGHRNADFLFDYTYMLRDAYMLDSLVVNQYLDAIDSKDLLLERNIRYIYEFCIHNFNIFIPFNNPRFEFLFLNKEKFYAHFDKSHVHTRIVWILKNAIGNAIETKDEITFKKAIELLKEFDTGEEYLFYEMDGRLTGIISSKHLVLSSTLNYYENMEDKTIYTETLELYISKIWNDENELNNFAWRIFKHADDDDSDKIKTALKCSIRSIELKNNYANNDTYAWLLYKSGDKQNALKQAKIAIEIAKQNDEDFSETQKLVDITATK